MSNPKILLCRGVRRALSLLAVGVAVSLTGVGAATRVALAQTAPAAAPAAAAPSGPVYNIELIVFRATSAPAASEDWTVPAPRPARAAEAGGAEGAAAAAVVGRMVGMLPAERLQLQDLKRRLTASGQYQALAHVAWSQTPSSFGSRAGFTLPRLGIAVPGLSGLIYLERGSFLHLGVALKYMPSSNGPSYDLNELRRVRFFDKNYYDHPAYGVIAVVTPAQGARPPGR